MNSGTERAATANGRGSRTKLLLCSVASAFALVGGALAPHAARGEPTRKPAQSARAASAASAWDPCHPLTLTIHRKLSNANCMLGYLAINGKVVGYTLERPDLGNINDISAIPAGNYSAVVRYDKERERWRLQLEVPGRRGVQVHVGNNVGQTKGCILVGRREPNAKNCTIGNSAGALRMIREQLNDPRCSSRRINVAVEDAVRSHDSAGECRDMTACVALETKFPKGLGHCDGEMVGYFTNQCNSDVHCSYAAVEAGKFRGPGGTKVRRDARVGGEMGGIWYCSGTEIRYRCVAFEDPESCRTLVGP
jgi:hypothetical protein